MTPLLLAWALSPGWVTYAADAGTTVLQPPNFTLPTNTHPITNSPTAQDYQQMQDSAPEAVVLRITSVKTEVGKPADASVDSAPLMVTAQAVVISVKRTATALKTGSVLYLLYGYAPPAAGRSSYAPIPVVKNNTEYTAYLAGGPTEPYRPAAGAESFIDEATAKAARQTSANASGPLANPALLPSPDNPTPVGVPRLTKNNLAQFAKVAQLGVQWGVSIANADPLPLQSPSNSAPILLAYYPAAIRAPATQPKILVYQTGAAPSNTPPTVTTERALIIDGNGKELGDVTWAWRSPEGQKPIPLPIWRWSTYKLDVEDPTTHAVQTVLLTGDNTPANSAH